MDTPDGLMLNAIRAIEKITITFVNIDKTVILLVLFFS